MLATSTNHSQTGWGIPVITRQYHVAFTPVWLGPKVRIRICDRLISYITMWMVKGFFSKVSINTVCRYYDAVSAWVQCGCTCLWQQAAADSWEQTVTSTWRDRVDWGLGSVGISGAVTLFLIYLCVDRQLRCVLKQSTVLHVRVAVGCRSFLVECKHNRCINSGGQK